VNYRCDLLKIDAICEYNNGALAVANAEEGLNLLFFDIMLNKMCEAEIARNNR